MARSLSSDLDVKRKDLISIYPEDLVVDHKKRGREFPPTAEQVEALAISIANKGQLQPVAVTITHDKKLELAAGFTRYEALLLLNRHATEAGQELRRIECKVIDGNPEETFLANIAENRDRHITSAIDDAHNVRRLGEQFSKTDAEICAIYADNGTAKSQAWLDGMRKLLRLDRQQQYQIHIGQIASSTGLVLADMAPEARKEALEAASADGKPVTSTKLIAAARKAGSLTKKTSLRAPEMKAAWRYLASHEDLKNTKVARLATLVGNWTSGMITEPDFFGALKKLLEVK